MEQLVNRVQAALARIHPMPQNVLILRLPIIASKEAAMRKVLVKINQDPGDNAMLPFSVFDDLHFARFLILEGPEHPGTYDSTLVFIANVDGLADDFLDDLVIKTGPGLDQLLSSCTGYPAKSRRTRYSRKAFLLAHALKSQTDYTNTVGRRASMVRQEEVLRDTLRDYLNELDQLSFKSAKELRKQVIAFVRNNPELSWALAPRPKASLLWRSIESIRFAAIASMGALVLLWGWPILLVWILVLRYRESRDPEDTHRPPLEWLTQLRSSEDIAAHNPFAAIGYLKPGLLRLTTVRALLPAAQAVLRHVFNEGDLAGIPLLGLDGVDTIHFAHWIMLDDDQRLLFVSNYDGSLESYMVDFIDKVSWGLNLIFSNGKGYPRTRWIVHDGARKEQRFKDYLGNHQLENQVWFSAYPKLTAVNIANNEAIHDGLRGHMSERQARAWLQGI